MAELGWHLPSTLRSWDHPWGSIQPLPASAVGLPHRYRPNVQHRKSIYLASGFLSSSFFALWTLFPLLPVTFWLLHHQDTRVLPPSPQPAPSSSPHGYKAAAPTCWIPGCHWLTGSILCCGNAGGGRTGLQDTASAQQDSVEGSDAELGLCVWLSRQ